MNCPACGVLEARVMRTIMGPSVDRRQRQCRCGVVWNTTERIDPGSLRTIGVKGEKGNAHQEHAIKRAAESLGSLSSPCISNQPLSSDQTSNPSLVDSPNRARVGRRGRPSTAEYSSDFEQFWGSISVRRGNKQPAFEAWVKKTVGISPTLIFTRYEQWAATPQWQDGFAQYVATWLNQKGWENEPGPAERRSRGTARSDGNVDALQDFLARGTG